MVRLKATRFLLKVEKVIISIPYGAIKSIYKHNGFTMISISIPYGAIKSRRHRLLKMA